MIAVIVLVYSTLDRLACLLHTFSHAETSANRKSDDMTTPRQESDAGHGGRETSLGRGWCCSQKALVRLDAQVPRLNPYLISSPAKVASHPILASFATAPPMRPSPLSQMRSCMTNSIWLYSYQWSGCPLPFPMWTDTP
jgi:hypothetical protein